MAKKKTSRKDKRSTHKIDDAYDRLEALRAAEDQDRRGEKDLQDRVRKLEAALREAQHFVLADNEDSADPKLFASRWAERWIAAAAAVREYEGIETLAGLELPTDPVYLIAGELFDMALSGVEVHDLAQELQQTIERLKVPEERAWEPRPSGLKVNGLREFFRYLSEALLADADLASPDGKDESAQKDEGSVQVEAGEQAPSLRDRIKDAMVRVIRIVHGVEKGPKRKRRRGRPLASDPKEEQRICDAWATGRYRKHRDLDSAMNLPKGTAKRTIERVHKREARRTK